MTATTTAMDDSPTVEARTAKMTAITLLQGHPQEPSTMTVKKQA